MSERVGKIGLNAGTPWSLFAENTAFEDSEGIADPKGGNTETARLHKEDMRLFGLCPAKDNLMLAVCKECNKILQMSMLAAHYERKHPKMLSSFKRSPSRRCSVSNEILSPSHSFGKSKLLKSPGDNSFIRIEEVDPTDINVKIEEVPLTIPKFNHTAKGKLAKTHGKNIMNSGKGKNGGEKQTGNLKLLQKKQILNKDKEYDPERHCGVWIEEQTRNCTRSLTCKTHSLASRREVTGRSKLFDVLLAEHKTRMQNNREGGSSSGATTPTATPSPTRTSTPTFPLKSERTPTDPRSPLSKEVSRSEGKRHISSEDHSSPFNQLQPTYVDYVTEDRNVTIPTISRHPKPMAVNTFAARRTGGGCLFFSRKLETFRHAAQSMVDKFIRANSCTSNSISNISETNGVCSTQIIDEGMGSRAERASSFVMNSYSSTEPSRFGSVPRVKTKTKSNSSANLKRQISDTSVPDDYLSSRKRRHSADSLKNESVNRDTNLLENSTNDNNNSRDSSIDLAKCVTEIGQGLRGFDVESLDTNFLSGSLLSSDTNQSGISNLTITGGSLPVNMNQDIGLNSSLSLCQTMGLNHAVSPNLSLNLGAQQNPIVLEHGQVVSQLLAPNIAVTKGMMVSLPNVSQIQNLSAYQGNLKEILPALSSSKQQNTSTGLYVSAQAQQASSKLVNGTVSSPDSFNITYNPGQSFSVANPNQNLKASNTLVASASKRLAISSNQRVSQLVVKQPSQNVQAFQRDGNTQRSSPFQKPAPYDLHKTPSPSQNSPTPSRSPSQQQTAATTQLLSNTAQLTTSSQPIAHLKQLQMQQLQQQQHQLMSPLNSSTIQAESLSYQQQILPKLIVSPNRNLPAQIVNTQTIQVNAQHMQQRPVLEPSTP